MTRVCPVILSGGTGSRLWPLSREGYPKQLLPLIGPETMLQATARRVDDPERFARAIVVANADHRFVIAEQLRSMSRTPQIVLEPVGRNTAPAIAVGALLAAQRDSDAVLLVMPADHEIGDVAAFHAAVERGLAAAVEGHLVLFGVQPTKAETGYGYIRLGEPLKDMPGVRGVSSFAEKPDAATAAAYLADGSYRWNSGIFLLPARLLLEELERLQQDLLASARSSVEASTYDLDFVRLDTDSFRQAPFVSIDVAVMERTSRAAVVPVEFPWSDVGAWSALWEISAKDAAGNAVVGDAILDEASGCYVRGEGQLVAAIGVQDLIIVATPDAVLVTSKTADQNVKRVIEKLRASGREVATQTQRVHPRGATTSRFTWETVFRSSGSRFRRGRSCRCRSTSIVPSTGSS
jgi:mannose-1-phosphate guanylyltransferase/mannose-6-phosphate isomerase